MPTRSETRSEAGSPASSGTISTQLDSKGSGDGPLAGGLARTQQSRPLRAGVCTRGRAPFAYRNARGQLVGYSIELAGALADALQARVEIVEVGDDWEQALRQGQVDILLSPTVVAPQLLGRFAFPAIYASTQPVRVHRDTDRAALTQRYQAGRLAGLRVGVLHGGWPAAVAATLLPGATLVPVDTPEQLLTDPTLDALLWLEVEASCWEIGHVEFGRLVLHGAPCILGYPVRLDDTSMQAFIERWIETLGTCGELQRLANDWMLGRAHRAARPAPAERLLRWLRGEATAAGAEAATPGTHPGCPCPQQGPSAALRRRGARLRKPALASRPLRRLLSRAHPA